MTRPLAVAAVLALCMIGLAPAAASEPPPQIDGRFLDDAPALDGRRERVADSQPAGHSPGSDSAPSPTVHTRVPACPGNNPSNLADGFCPGAQDACPGDEVLYWLYSAPRPADPETVPTWTQTGQACLAPADPADPAVLPAMTQQDFQRLPLPAGTPSVEPPNGYTLINIDTNVYATADPITLDTQLLGYPVQVRATPTRYTWNFGDGTTTGPTTDPGAPYPNLRITHTYTAPGNYDITLTTHYRGQYSVAGGPWLPIPGEAHVPSTPTTITALAGRNKLVADTKP